ncbi:MAG: hypothetical protein KC478_10250 [Bacteriovoracaceae bacterium]|nr:hypothetical protein [Bacteriovoracaceae bacterium]
MFKTLIVASLIFLQSCSQFTIRDRAIASRQSNRNCLSWASEFSLEYLTHPQSNQFKNAQDFIYFQDTLVKFKVDEPRLLELGADPDHNNYISMKSIQEAESVLIAERRELIPGPIIRGPAEIDFYDDLGRPWDVKTPISPTEYEAWEFDISQVSNSIVHQLEASHENFETQIVEPVRILVDLRNTNSKHRLKVNAWIYGNLEPEEIARIRIIQ